MTRRKTPENSRRFPFFLSEFLIFFLTLSSCGIATYPYLYPAERLSPPEEEVEGFRHDPRNADTGVFKGYELYYRIYKESDFTNTDDRDNTITSDMHSYFNGTPDFSAISSDEMEGDTDLPAGSDEGYRRFYIDDIGNTLPLIGDFDAGDLVKVNIEPNIPITLEIFDTKYELKRNAVKDDEFTGFTTEAGDYAPGDNDIVGIDSFVSGVDKLIVAVFVVPYGLDKFSRIFANGTSDDMTYIGYFEYQL